MAEFLDTNGINYRLDQIFKEAKREIFIISPYLKFNERVRQRLEDQDRMKINIQIVYGKSELQPQEITWLRSLSSVRTSFCKNLHAKCYLNESTAIVASMNLYEFSQVNNHEMGMLVERQSEPDLYDAIYEEARRLLRISDEVRLSVEKVVREAEPERVSEPASAAPTVAEAKADAPPKSSGEKKLSTSKLGRKHKLKAAQVLERLVARGYLVPAGDDHRLTPSGVAAGGERKVSKRFGPYFLWPEDLASSSATSVSDDESGQPTERTPL